MNNLPEKIEHIHLIAICGTGMGSLAGLLAEAGYRVTGSDQNIYPPMSTELERRGIPLYSGFKPENLAERPDLIIVGNAVSKDNPEVLEMQRLEIPYMSMPQALSHFFITGKKSMVIAGTHGKTTTTAILSHLLKELNTDPSYMVAGILREGEKNTYAGTGEYFVIEGDEYDTAFFDKGPKFLHYQPYYTIITSLEFDHADIYRDLDHLCESFAKLIQLIHPQGCLIANAHYPRLVKLKDQAKVPVYTYGLDEGDWQAHEIDYQPTVTQFDIIYKHEKQFRLSIPLAGKHNVQNALACVIQLRFLDYGWDQIQKAFSTFKGIKRRQEERGRVNDIIVIDDFAHHPTAVRETIEAIKNRYQGYQIWALFEPRSNTSMRDLFQKDYAQAFTQADRVFLAPVFNPGKIKTGKVLDVNQLAQDIQTSGPATQAYLSLDSLYEDVTTQVQPKTVLLMMSNGAFGGMHERVLKGLGGE